MPSTYSQHSLTVLALFGILAAVMSVLSLLLIFQIQGGQLLVKQGPSPAGFSVAGADVLLPVSAVLAALCLSLNISCLSICLLHSYFTTDVCRGDADPDRGVWFLMDSRIIRHAAIGLFCFGVAVYLAALSIYMLLLFDMEAGITSACILSSGILVLLITVTHSLLKASQATRWTRAELTNTIYENDSAHGGDAPVNDLNNCKEMPRPKPRPEIHREFSYPPYIEQKKQSLSPVLSNLTATARRGTGARTATDGDIDVPRMHRTLSAESGFFQSHGKPWNGVNQEMRNILSQKPGGAGKDSTLV
ncbi:transmembrane protein 221 [Microcaecilia unicolor]|uniref:Transmembrane protein 221 n=1 Tax=Microcaecilia unicolor TaxID=1415580 RepID=A0A6P7Z336_9AMPH|nr:transmembrane protein 221 [Microcaecilia unicolor]